MKYRILLTALLSFGIILSPQTVLAQMDQTTAAPSATANPVQTETPQASPNPFESPSSATPGTEVVTQSGSNPGDWGLIGLLGLLGLLGLRRRR
jgi:MYXO-CTERM domain-containing protein